jgi:hypothetical protein
MPCPHMTLSCREPARTRDGAAFPFSATLHALLCSSAEFQGRLGIEATGPPCPSWRGSSLAACSAGPAEQSAHHRRAEPDEG